MSDPAGASIYTVNHLYATIFEGIVKTDPLAYSIAAQTFRLMLCLHETISPTALLAAASITRDGPQNSLELSDLLRICSHLVILDDELDTICFAHASVQEYLSRLPEFSTINANSAVASSCLTRCVDSLLPDLTLGVQPSRDFDVYAAMYWPLHYTAASEHDRNGYLRDALEEFMFSDQDFMSPFPSWIETVDEIVKILSGPHARLSDLIAVGSESATPFFTACIYGLEFAIEILSRISSFDVDQMNARGNTGLYLASAAGQIRVVDVLLRLGADIAIEGGRHTTPLQAACANGHGDIAQLIIDFSNQQLTTGLMASAIQAALRNGYEDVAVILLKKNAVPMSQDTLDQVFEAAAGMGFAELMQYLHLTSKSLSGNKKLAIKGAVKIFHDTKLEWFRNYFQHKALPKDAVATAAFYGQNKIVEFFLDKGLDIEQEGPFGTPLRAASLMGHGTTVRLLLNRDAIVNSDGPFGDALQAAAMKGHLSITTMLIQSGVAVDNPGGYYGNALQAATYRGHIEVVKALLAADASIDQKGLFSDALSAAVSAGNQPITKLLLQSGYRSPYLMDDDEAVMRSAALASMSSTSHVNLLSALHSTHHSKRTRQADRAKTMKGQDLSFGEAYKSIHDYVEVKGVMESEDREHYKQYESHALLVAIETGQESVVQSMLDYRSAIGLSSSHIGVALKVASAAGQLGIVDHILSLPDLPGRHIPRAMERAAWYGHVAVIRRLLQCEEAYGPPPDSHYTPFTPRGDTQYKRMCSYKKKARWSDYFPLSYEAVETNEPAETSHIMRILLLGCRGNAPATVELALQLAAESGLRDLFATALAITIESNSELALEVLFRHYPTIEATVLKEACTQAEKEESLRVLYVLLQHNRDHGYQVQDYWNVYDGADRTKHSSLISYLNTQIPNWQDDSVFARTFVEAAQHGYVSALKSWERRLFELFNYDLLMSQALDQACANGHAVVASYLIELGADVNTIIEKPMEASGPIKHRRVSRNSYGLDTIQVWPRTALQACLQATPQYTS
jgi:ankyrin repeat protein